MICFSSIHHLSIINLSHQSISSINQSINQSIYLYIYLSSIHHLTLSIICLSSIYNLSIIYLSINYIYLPIYQLTTYLSSIYNLISSINLYPSSINHQSIIFLSSFYHLSTHTLRVNTNINQIALPLLLNHLSYIIIHLSSISYHVINVQLIKTFGVISTRSSE